MSIERKNFPLPDTDWEPTRGYWEAAAREQLSIPRCSGCGAWTWYPKESCPVCGNTDMPWTRLSGRATLFSFVVVHHAFLPQYQGLTPFLPALVVPEEAPSIRLTTRLVDCRPEELRMDMPVEAVFRPLEFKGVDGSVIAPLFRPA